MNNIPKDSNVYNSSNTDFAILDNKLAASQLDIGESSNLAQVAQTYACNFADTKYDDYVCILSVLAQVAIDSAKRQFDIDIMEEIPAAFVYDKENDLLYIYGSGTYTVEVKVYGASGATQTYEFNLPVEVS